MFLGGVYGVVDLFWGEISGLGVILVLVCLIFVYFDLRVLGLGGFVDKDRG